MTGEEAAELPSWRLDAVDPARMKILALLLADPNPLHFDPDAVIRLGVADRLVNQGPSNMAMLMNMLMEAMPAARIKHFRVRLLGSVLAGDVVEATGRVVSRQPEGESVRVRCELTLTVAGRGDVLAGEATLLVPPGLRPSVV
jgi:acyl dehydratase